MSDEKKTNQNKPEANKPEAPTTNKTENGQKEAPKLKLNAKTDKAAAEVFEKLNPKELYVNSKGEIFTNESYAVNSEDGNHKKVQIIRKSDLK